MTQDSMRIYEDLKEMVEDEIHKIVKKDDIDEPSLMHLDKLVDIAKDIDTIFAMNNYDSGSSYGRRPYMHYDDMAHSYTNRGDMGRYWGSRYSREGELVNKLHKLMDDATTEREREAIRKAIDHI